MKTSIQSKPKPQEPRTRKENEQPTLRIKVGNDIQEHDMHKLETFSDMCRVVNLDNIDNFLKDFEVILRVIAVSTENVNKTNINFGPMLWKED